MTLATPTTTQLWNTMPGWGITADLLPPEIVAARRVRVLRKIVAAVLGVVLVLGAGGYAYGLMQKRSAASALDAANSMTARLHSQQSKYAPVVQAQSATALIESQLATLMTDDVDVSHLVQSVLSALPNGATVTELQAALTSSTATPGTAASVPSTNGSDVLDTSGRVHIGAITITGTARSMNDIARYGNRLSAIPGVVAVYPTSEQVSGRTAQFTLEVALTDELLTHRFTAPTTTPGGR